MEQIWLLWTGKWLLINFGFFFLFTTPFLYQRYFTIFLFVFKTTYNILQYIQDIFKTFIINEFQGIRYIGESLFVILNSYCVFASGFF